MTETIEQAGEREIPLIELARNLHQMNLSQAGIVDALRRSSLTRGISFTDDEIANILRFACVPVNLYSRALTDLGNAERLVDAFGEDIRYSDATGKWLTWSGVRWEPTGRSGPQQHMQSVVRTICREAEFVKPLGESEDAAEKAEQLIQSIVKFAQRSESNNAIFAATQQARTMPQIRVNVQDFDADPYLLNLLNGTLNLKTFEFRAHDKRDLMTKLAPVAYDQDVDAPLWEKFLETSVPNAETRRFLQQAAGYTLSGNTSEDCLFLNIGHGRNGKGVFLNSLKTILGDYALQANFDSFTASKGGGGIEVRTDLARLAGARMVIASENEQDKRLAEGLLKTLTGSDTITARKLYEAEQEFLPQFKLWFAVNHEPKILGVDEGIWSRIHRIPWNVFVKPEDRIKNLKETIIQGEASGVLNWMLAGLKDYAQNGLVRSGEIIEATETYRRESDVVNRFLEERWQRASEDKTVLKRELYSDYKFWTTQAGEYYTATEKQINSALEVKGFQSKHTRNGAAWVGLIRRQPMVEVVSAGEATDELLFRD